MAALPSSTLVSVVVPVLNEEDTVGPLYERVRASLEAADVDFELIFSADPCSDRTEDAVRELRTRDPRVKLIRLSRRFGQPAATMAGLRMSNGDAVAVIDADLQDPPELLGEMIERWREGFDVVYAQRRSREGETLVKRFVAWMGYRVIRRVAEVDIPENTGDFRLMSRRVVDEVLRLNETHGFLRGLVALVGFPQTSVAYDRDPRAAGASKYNRFWGSIRIGVNGIVGFSRYPLHLISLLGIAFFVVAMLLGLTYFVLAFVNVDIPWGNPTLVMLISLFSGIQLLSLGVMGEYVGRIYDEVKRRPMFIVESLEGFEQEDDVRVQPPAPRRARGARNPALIEPVCILAGGRGERLGDLTRSVPKPMVDVAGRPFVDHQLLLLAEHGARQVVLCVEYLAEAIEQHVGDGRRYGLEVAYSRDEPGATGTAGAIRGALSLLGDAFLVLYGDTYLRIDYADVARRFRDSGLPALMTVLENANELQPSNAVVEDDRVVAYDKASPPAGSRWIDYGLLAFRSSVFATEGPADLADVLRELAAEGDVAAYEAKKRFYDIGTPEALAETEAFLGAQPSG